MAVSRLLSAAARGASAPPPVPATTVREETADLIAALPAPGTTVGFLTGGDGLVGWGEAARFETSGPGAAARIRRWFADRVAELEIRDDLRQPGTGPVAFVSMGFDERDASVAVLPSVVLGRRDGVSWRTTIGRPNPVAPVPVRAPGPMRWADPAPSVDGFTDAVRTATDRIRRGELEKVVLAHDLAATAAQDIDERHVLRRLAAAYPTCWTFAVDGLVGASPEMLVHRFGPTLFSRVLAGTAWAEGIGNHVSERLMTSAKNLREHAFAVRSVAAALEPVARLEISPGPRPLVLANLTHLATDVTGALHADSADSVLDLADRLHPTAAVGGTPTAAALAAIRELEPAPRGRYAGPVGWLDTRGDGEFALALRCAQISGRSVRLLAGCGIVADSDPATEAREAQVKMIPIRDALQG